MASWKLVSYAVSKELQYRDVSCESVSSWLSSFIFILKRRM